MTTTNTFTSYADQSGQAYNGTDLEQLNAQTNVIQSTKDPVSGLESVVLADGPFAYTTETYINSSIKDYRKQSSTAVTNTPFPVKVESGGFFNVRLPIKADYLIVPNTIDVSLEIELKVRQTDGVLRSVLAKDCLCPNDSLNPIANVRPYFDGKPVIAPGKAINQRQFGRVLSLITEKIDTVEEKNRRIRHSRTFFEGQKTADNRAGLTHSHIWVDKPALSDQQNPDPPVVNEKIIRIKTKNDAGKFSAQNTTLSNAVMDKFLFHLDLSHIPPFNQSVVYSRPCAEIILNLEFADFSDWLRVSIYI